MNDPHLVSVVIPVYNGEQYLVQCIDSVLAQTYQNWECIIANNCSSDTSLEIATSYANKDKRFKVYNNERFLSMIDNFNQALQKISTESKYCKMVLADDFLVPDCLEKMVHLAESHGTIGVVSSYQQFATIVGNVGLPFGKNAYSGRDICRIQLLDERKYFFGTETTLMFRSDIVRERVPFWQGKSSFCWDGETCYQILKSCNFGFVFSPLSFTRRENSSFKASLARFNPDLFARFVWFKVYGKDYLSHEEYSLKEEDISRKYYLYLARKLMSRGVISFHKKELRNCGIEFQTGLLVKYAMWQLVFAPMRILKRALSKFA